MLGSSVQNGTQGQKQYKIWPSVILLVLLKSEGLQIHHIWPLNKQHCTVNVGYMVKFSETQGAQLSKIGFNKISRDVTHSPTYIELHITCLNYLLSADAMLSVAFLS